MKVAILLALVAAASAGILAPIHGGSSSVSRSEDGTGNYAFGYDEAHSTGGTFRRESGNAAGQVVGSYGLRDADGRVRTVNYVADALGYRAAISSNEPGVEPKDPASVTINKAATIIAAPVAVAHAPLFHSAALPVAPAPQYFHGPSGYSATINHAVALHAAPAIHAPILAAPAHAPWGYQAAW